MTDDSPRILLAEQVQELARTIIDHLACSGMADVTWVRTAEDALSRLATCCWDALLADINLPDGSGLELARKAGATSRVPVILLAEQLELDQAIEAIRVGVRDLLIKPIDMSYLTDSLQGAIRQYRRELREQARYRRLRQVASRIVRERRLLRQRVDLVCRDIVQAYRRLAEKFVEQTDLHAR